MYEIEDIEDAILDAIRKDKDLPDMCRTIASYSGEQADLMAEIEKMTMPLPAVFVAYAGSVFEEPANRAFTDEMTFILFVAAKNLRGRNQAARGVYEILEKLKTLLINNNLSLYIEPLHPVSIDPVGVSSKIAVYGLVLKTLFAM